MLAIRFRKYQEDILAQFEACRLRGEKRFHLVSPPGSGKTLMALEMVDRLALPAVVFVPTLAIQAQWLEAAKQWGAGLSISSEDDSAAGILVLSYQSISVKDAASGDLHGNAVRLLDLVRSRRVLVFDECHHLTREWARILKGASHDDHWLIALTATPPIDREKGEQEVYTTLLGDVSAEVDLPPVIKEGYLAPFQDLVYLVSPTDEEMAVLERKLAPWKGLLRALRETSAIVSLPIWAERRLQSYRGPRGALLTFDEFMNKDPALCHAFARIALHQGTGLPPSVIPDEAMEEAPRFPDYLAAFEDYLYNALLPLTKGDGALGADTGAARREARDLLARCDAALESLGYRRGPKRIRAGGQTVGSLLGNSYAKILAVKPILECEMHFMGDDFRCLILCDSASSKSGEGTGAMELLDFLTDCPQTDAANPVLLTGTTVLVDDDIADFFMAAAIDYARERGIELELTKNVCGGHVEIGSSSGEWTTRLYVPFISAAFERGLTRCLVSTKAMLGEGWNSLSLNTLIDLTAVTSFAFVNQMRGRTLRLDPQRPLKAANNWDIVSVYPDDEQGFIDLDRVRRKYSRFFGMGPAGTIERGAGHLHPFLEGHSPVCLHRERDTINASMLQRAWKRLAVYRAWNPGSAYRNLYLEVADLEREGEGKGPLFVWPRALLAACIRGGRLLRWLKNTSLAAGILLALVILFTIRSRSPFLPFFTLTALLSFVLSWALTQSSSFKRLVCAPFVAAASKPQRSLKSSVHTLSSLLVEGGRRASLLESEDEGARIRLVGIAGGGIRVEADSTKLSRFVSSSLADLLAPPLRQRYLLHAWGLPSGSALEELVLAALECSRREKLITAFKEAFQSNSGPLSFCVIPVPEVFSRSRETAEVFARLWDEKVASCSLVGPRQASEREKLVPLLARRSFPLRASRRELWI